MKGKKKQLQISDLKKLYNSPLPSNRNGALYNAFSYPTKISPESIGIFIACHTDVGATVLDPFAGSGTTGAVAAELGRSFILIDKSKEATDVIRKRLSEQRVQFSFHEK